SNCQRDSLQCLLSALRPWASCGKWSILNRHVSSGCLLCKHSRLLCGRLFSTACVVRSAAAVFGLAYHARRATASQTSWYLSEGDVAMESPTVLCIDDRPQVLELRKATLESHGYSVKIASSGYTAMKM